MSIYVTKEFQWDMAHMLAEHQGLCKNIHGHTYKMQVTVIRKSDTLISGTGASDGMVIDFKDLKIIVKRKIVEPLDHAFMYWSQSPDQVEHQIAELLLQNDRKVYQVNYRPTAEEMALNFFNILSQELEQYQVKVVSVKVWETTTSFAEAK